MWYTTSTKGQKPHDYLKNTKHLTKVNIHDKNSHESGHRQVIVIVQSPSRVWLSVTPWTAAQQVSLSFTISLSLLKLMSIELVMLFNQIILCQPFSFCLQPFPASRYFLRNQLITSDGQNIGVSASASVLPMNIQDGFPLGWTGLISLQFKGLLRVFCNTTVQKHQFISAYPSLWSNSQVCTWLLQKL